MTAIDIDSDGDLDLVCPGKSGLYLFENLGAEQLIPPSSRRGGGRKLGREHVHRPTGSTSRPK